MENIFNDCECLLDADKNISLIDTDKEYTLSGLVDSEAYKTDVRYINSDGKYIFGYHDQWDRRYNPIGLYTDEHILWLDEYDQNEEEYPYYVENVEYCYYSMYSEIGSYDATDSYYEDEPDYKKEGVHYKEYDSENIEDVLQAKQVDLYENRYVNNRIEYYDEFVHHTEGSLKNKEDYYTAKAERLRSIGVTGKILNGLPLTFEVIVPR